MGPGGDIRESLHILSLINMTSAQLRSAIDGCKPPSKPRGAIDGCRPQWKPKSTETLRAALLPKQRLQCSSMYAGKVPTTTSWLQGSIKDWCLAQLPKRRTTT
jgi:hypothetical protein